MNQHLIEKPTPANVLKFTFPTIIMMISISLYTMVDGVFIANFIGDNALSSTNIVYPVISGLIGIGIMLGTGANAVIARNLGAGNAEKARGQLTFIVVTGIFLGLFIAVFCALFIRPIVTLLGATPLLFDDCVEYLFFIILAAPFALLQLMFQSFFVTAGRPKLGLAIIVAGGAANIFFDYLFIAVMEIGIKGAAFGTALAYIIPAVFGLVYFSARRGGTLYFTKPEWNWKMLASSCFNGSSEMVSNLATAVTTFLFNKMMLNFLGEDGVAAITIAMYLQFLLTAVFMGYSTGVAPVFSFNYGREDPPALKKLFQISLGFVIINSILWYLLSIVLKNPLISIFAEKGSGVFFIASEGWYLFAVCFLFTGLNIFASAMFTAFSDGKTSAIISFLRTFLFLSASILLLPQFLGGVGIWLSVPVAEGITFIISILYLVKMRHRYKYL